MWNNCAQKSLLSSRGARGILKAKPRYLFSIQATDQLIFVSKVAEKGDHGFPGNHAGNWHRFRQVLGFQVWCEVDGGLCLESSFCQDHGKSSYCTTMKQRQPTKWMPNFGQKNIVYVPEVQDCHPDDFHFFFVVFSHVFPFFHFQQTLQQFAKDIKITSTQVIQNLPKESREFTKTCKDYCEQWLDVRKMFLTGSFWYLPWAILENWESIRWRWKQVVLKLENITSKVVNDDFRIQEFFDLQICAENMDFWAKQLFGLCFLWMELHMKGSRCGSRPSRIFYIRILPVVVRYQFRISDAGVSVDFTGRLSECAM